MSDDLRTVLTGLFFAMLVTLLWLIWWIVAVIRDTMRQVEATRISRQLVAEASCEAIFILLLFCGIQPLAFREEAGIRAALVFGSFGVLILSKAVKLVAWRSLREQWTERRVVRAVIASTQDRERRKVDEQATPKQP